MEEEGEKEEGKKRKKEDENYLYTPILTTMILYHQTHYSFRNWSEFFHRQWFNESAYRLRHNL